MQNEINIIEDFKNAMYDGLGVAPNAIIADGVIHRFKDSKGKLNYWYNLHLDGKAAGVFGCWSTGTTIKWKASGDYQAFTEQQKLDFKIEAHRQKLIKETEAKQRHDKAASKAVYIWEKSTPATDHTYLTKKGIQPHTSRLNKDSLVIPIYNSKKLVSLQFIQADGTKRLLKDGLIKGSYCVIGDAELIRPDSTLLICEGWATGATLFEETTFTVFVAFSATNLSAVALQVREHYPDNEIVICGDNDLSGVGQDAANDAALLIDAKVAIPPDIGTDFNDYALSLREVHHGQ